MRSWESLAQDVKALQSQPYQWPSELTERVRQTLVSFERLCLSRLENLLLSSLTDTLKIEKITRFFAMRWTVIANTSLDYTRNPFLSSNTIYIEIAKRIVSPEESIINILIPTVDQVIGSGSEDIKLSTEMAGSVYLHNFILSSDNRSLISVDDVFEYARQDTHYLFHPIPENDEDDEREPIILTFKMTANDRDRLRHLTPEAKHYYDLLKQLHAIRHKQKPSVGYALYELIKALLRSSKIDIGADLVANLSECQQPIIDFYHIWTSLTEMSRNKISHYRAHGSTHTLHQLLFMLFSHTPGIALSDNEYAAIEHDLVACTHMIGQQLKTLLAHNLEFQNPEEKMLKKRVPTFWQLMK